MSQEGALALPVKLELAIIVGAREANDESAFVAHSADAVKAGKVHIAGAVYDLHSGKVSVIH